MYIERQIVYITYDKDYGGNINSEVSLDAKNKCLFMDTLCNVLQKQGWFYHQKENNDYCYYYYYLNKVLFLWLLCHHRSGYFR